MPDLAPLLVSCLAKGAAAGLLLYLIATLIAILPWRKQRTMLATAVLPYPRGEVWRAYFANSRLLTPDTTFETVAVGRQIEFEGRAGPKDELCRTIGGTVMANEPGRRFAMLIATCDGKPYMGGPWSMDGVTLEDDADGMATRVSLMLHVETPNLLHVLFMRQALKLTLAKMQRRLQASGPPLAGLPARA
jgi:hypothetical protein